LGILALHHSIRPAIYAIYGYVRLADEIVDSFHSFNKAELLQSFKEQTWSAIDQGISLNPILHSFQQAIKEYNIERKLIDQFLHSMEMDLQKIEYNSELYREYILGSAEVVGLMCLHVFVNGNKSMYEELKPYAMKLGSAFQKVNFLRDLNQDYLQLGRTYFPDLDLNHFTNENKLRIEKEIEAEFQEALLGIQKLPGSSKFGVFLAYSYYRSLFEKIRGLSAEKILNKRIRIPNSHKLSLMMSSYIKYKLAFV
jgi:15-cis-phytoene synthase